MPHIVMGNTKLGNQIPCVNMPPIMTCRVGAPCYKYCYARKGSFLYETVIKSHIENMMEFQRDPDGFFKQIKDFLNGVVTYKYFRWHSSGDVINRDYLERMVKLAQECSQTEFLAYTKKFELWNQYLSEGNTLPTNLHVVFSNWDKNFKVENPFNLPMTYVDFRKKEMNPEMPKDAYVCPGSCEGCLRCWKLQKGEAVMFHQH